MSEPTNACPPLPGLRERLAARKSEPRLWPGHVEGLGDVQVLRLRTEEALAIVRDESRETSHALVAATIMDENGEPLFASAADLVGLDWPLTQALVRACNKINLLDVENAQAK